jgi:hypothetical protein
MNRTLRNHCHCPGSLSNASVELYTVEVPGNVDEHLTGFLFRVTQLDQVVKRVAKRGMIDDR